MDLLHHFGVEARIDDLLAVLPLLNHAEQNDVHHLVGRQDVAVLLPGVQLRRRLLGQDAFGNRIAHRAVDIARHVVHFAFVEVARGAERPGRVAVKRAESQRVLALVRGVEQDMPRLVLQGHEQHGADTGLDVLLGRVELRAADHRLERVHHAGVDFRNGNDVVTDAQVRGQPLGVLHRLVGRKGRRHEQRPDILRPQRIHGDRGHHGRVDAARKADRGFLVAVLAEEVAYAAAGRLVDQPRTLIIRRRDRNRCGLGLRVEQLEILFETLHHHDHLAAAVHRPRSAVVNDLRRTAHLIGHHEVLALDEGQVAHHLVAVGHRSLAVTAGVDRDDRLHRLVEIALAAQIVAHHHGALVALDGDVLVALRRDQKTHFAPRRDVFLADIALYPAVFEKRGGADRPLAGQHRKPHQGRDPVAAGRYLLQRLFAQFEKGRLAQQVEGRRAAHGLLGENHQIGAPRLRLVDRADDLRRVSVDIPHRVVQLGYGYFHGSNLSR